jgi:hypothetical protein
MRHGLSQLANVEEIIEETNMEVEQGFNMHYIFLNWLEMATRRNRNILCETWL